eukprot:12056700-Alexandrium_andersonii.AAC.1
MALFATACTRSTDRSGIIKNFNFEASENMSEHCWRGAPAMKSLTSLRSGLPGSRKREDMR